MKKTRLKTIAVFVLVLTALVGLVLAGPGRGGRGSRDGHKFGHERPDRFGMGRPRGCSEFGPEEPGRFGMGRPRGRSEFGPEELGRFGMGRSRGGHKFGHERQDRFGMGMERLGRACEPGMQGMLGELELTDEQKESVKQINKAAKERNKTAAEAVGEARKVLREAVVKGDETAVRKAATNLGKVLGDQAVLKVQTTASIKAVLTPEQLKKLEELKTTMKERAGKFREKMDSPCFHKRFRGHRHKGDEGETRGGHRGFGPYGRNQNVGASNEP